MKGRTFYKFIDPATSHESKGGENRTINDGIENKFYLDENTGMLSRDGTEATGEVTRRRFEVSMVRLNKESQSSK